VTATLVSDSTRIRPIGVILARRRGVRPRRQA